MDNRRIICGIGLQDIFHDVVFIEPTNQPTPRANEPFFHSWKTFALPLN